MPAWGVVLLVNVSPDTRPLVIANLGEGGGAKRGKWIVNHAREVIGRFEVTHGGLVHGDASMGLTSALSPQARAMCFEPPVC